MHDEDDDPTSTLESRALDALTVHPIGQVESPYHDRQSAPRQPAAARDVPGRIVLYPRSGFEHALSDLSEWTHLWVIFWFHLNSGFRPKVAPPRSQRKRGVFATRAPYRPNPLGLSLVRLTGVEGLTLHVRDLDLLDGTPVLDLKPYVPYADTAPDAGHGWLTAPDPGPSYRVAFSERAESELAWLAAAGVVWLRERAQATLRLGPAPHPYRRIRADGDAMRIAIQDFRLRFTVDAELITVVSVHSGYKRKALSNPNATAKADTPLAVHRAFVERFG